MSFQFRVVILVVPLLTAGAALAQTGGPSDNATQASSSPLASIMPKGGLFGVLSGNGSAKHTAPPASGTPASDTSYWTDVKGSGPLGFAGVEDVERCTTKACNLYYGDAPADESEQPVAALPHAEVAPTAPEEEPRSARNRRGRDLAQRESNCAPTPQDPWRCYR